jgi:hypothetical protein
MQLEILNKECVCERDVLPQKKSAEVGARGDAL